MIPRRVGAVVNPAAGDGHAEQRLAELRAAFASAADGRVSIDAAVTDGPDAVHAAARDRVDADLLAVVGGDGTVREVAAAVGDRVPLFVVPAGRGNSTYRHVYGDADPAELAHEVAAGFDAVPLDVVRLRTEPPTPVDRFLLGCSAGLFRSALFAADRLRWLPGPVAYVLGTAHAVLVDDPIAVAVEADDGWRFEGEARLVAVAGGRYRGSSFDLFPDSRPADGSLHLLVVEPCGLRHAARVLRATRGGEHGDLPGVHLHRASTFDLRSVDGFPVEADGTPLSIVRDARCEIEPDGALIASPQ